MNVRPTVLVVEPDPSVGLPRMLRRLGFDVTVCGSPETALFEYGQRDVDAVVAVMPMPGMGAVAFTRELRRRGRTPVLVVTNTDESKWIDALHAGADDRLALPCDDRELRARLRSLMRRCSGSLTPLQVLNVGALTIRRHAGDVQLIPAIQLTSTQLTLLDHLASQPNVVVTTDSLLARIRNDHPSVDVVVVDTDLHTLQETLTAAAGHPDPLQHLDGAGWRLVAVPTSAHNP